ncbi:MAG: LuxR C-terminal-related transcriptional regulator [Steroidobacter sp.]
MEEPPMPAGRDERLRLKDVRAICRLIGECGELGREPSAWRMHMLEGLRGLTGAQLALYMHIHDLGQPQERLSEPLSAGFLDDSHARLWVHYQESKAHRNDPFHVNYYKGFDGSLRTRNLEAVLDQQLWLSSMHYNEYVRPCGLNDRITSSLRVPGDTAIQVIVLHRSAADGKYSRRAVRLMRVFHHELSMVLGTRLKMETPPANDLLPARLRDVLAGLIRGEAEKQIARRLGLSHNTVNRHVQRLYRRLDVRSRGELMYRLANTPEGLNGLVNEKGEVVVQPRP